MQLPLRLLPWLSAFALCALAGRAAPEVATALNILSAATPRTPAGLGGNAAGVAASESLIHARRAQALLGPGTWSRVIRVENTAARSRYPAVVHALVFEEAGILWFYTDADGTQSFTLNPNRLAEEKSDFSPLLHAIDPGFVAYEVLSDVARVFPPVRGDLQPNHGSGKPCHVSLPNACFIESLAALHSRVQRGEHIERARLLNCYVDTPAGRRGHTVLTYETPRGLFLLDPARSPEPRAMPPAWADDPMALAAAALQGMSVARARWVPTALPPTPTQIATLNFPQDNLSGQHRDL